MVDFHETEKDLKSVFPFQWDEGLSALGFDG